ncbi:MAG: HAD hydrolase-like protein [Verrucomicrobiae bacterium]|nr:HAD hydrolase-like protein [Verrucomicrobiae bacterium]
MVRAILFDVDGTLIRTRGVGVRAFARAFKILFGFPENTVEKISFAGRTDVSLAKEYFRLNGYSPTKQEIKDFFVAYVFLLDEMMKHSDGGVCPGVREFINQARKISPPPLIGLLTGNIQLGAEIKLRHFGIWDEFEVGAFADDSEDRNEIARVAFERTRKLIGEPLLGRQVVVVGDTVHDITCARAIGARALTVTTGGNTKEELKRNNPDWVVDDLKEISFKCICE